LASLTVIGDAHLVPDPEAITAAFNLEFQKMLKSAKLAAAKTTAPRAPARKAAARRKAAA
jgi:hypothetical protein